MELKLRTKNKLIFFIEYFWLFFLLLLASMVYLNQEFINLFFNSDELIPPIFFNDLFFKYGHYKDWIFSPVPHFFPDMLVTFPIFCIVKNVYFCFLIIIWIMMVSTYFAVKFIFHRLFSLEKSVIFSLTAVSSLFLLALKNFSPYNRALVPFYHIGEFIVGLFFIGMQLNLISKDKFSYKSYILCFFIVIIVFACSLSDLLFVIQFAVPTFITYSFFFLKKEIKLSSYLLLSSIVIFPAISGALLTKYLMPKDILANYLSHPSLMKVSFSTLNLQLVALIHVVKNSSNYLIKIIFSIFYLNLIFILGANLFISHRVNIKNSIDKNIFLCAFIFLSVFLSLSSQLFLATPVYVNNRYLAPLFFFPILFFPILFSPPILLFNNKLLASKIFTCLATLLFLCIIVNLFLLISKPGFKLNKNYYPSYVRCIDKALRGYGHTGIAQYWDANLISVLSKENVEALPVIDLYPFFWGVNVSKFKKPISFVVLDVINVPLSLNKNVIYRSYGIPDKIVICDKKEIRIYSKNLKLN